MWDTLLKSNIFYKFYIEYIFLYNAILENKMLNRKAHECISSF